MRANEEEIERARMEGELVGVRWAYGVTVDWGENELVRRARRFGPMQWRYPAIATLTPASQMRSRIGDIEKGLNPPRCECLGECRSEGHGWPRVADDDYPQCFRCQGEAYTEENSVKTNLNEAGLCQWCAPRASKKADR